MNKLSVIILFLLISCGSNKGNKATTIECIEFGTGGGITGEITSYSINNEGELLLNNEKTIKSLSADETFAIFDAASSFLDYDYRQPKNMYNFITIKSSNKTNRIVWGAESDNFDANVLHFFKRLMKSTIITE